MGRLRLRVPGAGQESWAQSQPQAQVRHPPWPVKDGASQRRRNDGRCGRVTPGRHAAADTQCRIADEARTESLRADLRERAAG